MNLLVKNFSAVVLSLSTVTALAAPSYLTTHNETDVQSNAFIAGTIPSPYPTAPHSKKEVHWNLVKLACYGHTKNNKCPALVKMATNTSNPIEVGYLEMDLTTGEITPSLISSNGYTLTVNGPAEATITKD